MSARHLEQSRILIAEDDHLIAAKLGYGLAELGASILGPASSMQEAIVLLVREGRPDGAILDVGLGGAPAFALADILMQCDVPIIFTANHYPMIMPPRFASVPLLHKPVTAVDIAWAHETFERWHAYG